MSGGRGPPPMQRLLSSLRRTFFVGNPTYAVHYKCCVRSPAPPPIVAYHRCRAACAVAVRRRSRRRTVPLASTTHERSEEQPLAAVGVWCVIAAAADVIRPGRCYTLRPSAAPVDRRAASPFVAHRSAPRTTAPAPSSGPCTAHSAARVRCCRPRRGWCGRPCARHSVIHLPVRLSTERTRRSAAAPSPPQQRPCTHARAVSQRGLARAVSRVHLAAPPLVVVGLQVSSPSPPPLRRRRRGFRCTVVAAGRGDIGARYCVHGTRPAE